MILFILLFSLHSFECSTFGYQVTGAQMSFNATLNALYHYYTHHIAAFDAAIPLLENHDSLFSQLLASFNERFKGKKDVNGHPDVTVLDKIWNEYSAATNKTYGIIQIQDYLFKILFKGEKNTRNLVAGNFNYQDLGFDEEYGGENYSEGEENYNIEPTPLLVFNNASCGNEPATAKFWGLNNERPTYAFYMSTTNFDGKEIWYDASYNSQGEELLVKPEKDLEMIAYLIVTPNMFFNIEKILSMSGQAPPIYNEKYCVYSFSFQCPDQACLNKLKIFFGNEPFIYRRKKILFMYAEP